MLPRGCLIACLEVYVVKESKGGGGIQRNVFAVEQAETRRDDKNSGTGDGKHNGGRGRLGGKKKGRRRKDIINLSRKT